MINENSIQFNVCSKGLGSVSRAPGESVGVG
jgi:hypothetical protein